MNKKTLVVVLIIIALAVGALGGFYGGAKLSCDPYVWSMLFSTKAASSESSSEDGVSETGSSSYSDSILTDINYLKSVILSSYYTEVDEEDLNTGILKGLVEGLDDPYSEYLTAEELDEFFESFEEEEYGGIGVVMQADYSSGLVKAIRVVPGSPAEAAGIVRGDYITEVDGVSYGAADLDDCASHARGEAGTDVVIGLYHNGHFVEKTITRATLSVPSVYYSTLSEYGEDDICYIEVTSFAEDTADEFSKALTEAEKSGAKAIIVDIRDNGGGLVSAAVSMADMLMDAATVVYTEDHDGNREYYTTENGKVTDKQVLLLVNEYSASSSEIFAAGLQENGRATLVGTQTYGKGIIQQIMQLYNGAGLKLTKWQYFTATGKAIHKVGVTPDYVVEFEDSDYDENGYLVHDSQLLKAIELINEK